MRGKGDPISVGALVAVVGEDEVVVVVFEVGWSVSVSEAWSCRLLLLEEGGVGLSEMASRDLFLLVCMIGFGEGWRLDCGIGGRQTWVRCDWDELNVWEMSMLK